MIRVASAANAQSTPLTASVTPSEPGTGTMPESNAKTTNTSAPTRANAEAMSPPSATIRTRAAGRRFRAKSAPHARRRSDASLFVRRARHSTDEAGGRRYTAGAVENRVVHPWALRATPMSPGVLMTSRNARTRSAEPLPLIGATPASPAAGASRALKSPMPSRLGAFEFSVELSAQPMVPWTAPTVGSRMGSRSPSMAVDASTEPASTRTRTASSSMCAASASIAAAMPSALATTTAPCALVARSSTATRPAGSRRPSSTSSSCARDGSSERMLRSRAACG